MYNNPYQEKKAAGGVSPGLILAGAAVIVIIFGAGSQADASRRAASLQGQDQGALAQPPQSDPQALAQMLARKEAKQTGAWDCNVVAGQPVCSPVAGKGFVTEDKCARYCQARARAENRRAQTKHPEEEDAACAQPEETFCKTMPKANCGAWTKQCPCRCAGVATAEQHQLKWVGKRADLAPGDAPPAVAKAAAQAGPLAQENTPFVADNAAPAAPSAPAASADCNVPEESFCKSMPKANCAAWTKECPCKCAGVAKSEPEKVVWVGKKPKAAAPLLGTQAAATVPKPSDTVGGCDMPEEPFCKTMPKANCAAWTKECPCKCRREVQPDTAEKGGLIAGSAADCPNEEEWCRFLDRAKCTKWSANCPCRCK